MPLTITDVNLPSAPFGVESLPAAGGTIEPGSSITITVTFNPTTAGAFSGQIALQTTAGDETIDLSGAASKSLVQLLPGGLGMGGSSVPEATMPRFIGAELMGMALTANASGTIGVKVSCPAGESSCAGAITLRTTVAAGAAAGAYSKAHRVTSLTLAKGSFTVTGGRVSTVRLRLSKKARALLAHTHVLRAQATIVSHDPAGAAYTAQVSVTIRAPKQQRARKTRIAG